MTKVRSCYTVEEAAEILAVSGNTVRRLLRNKELIGGKIGSEDSAQAQWRIQHEDLDNFMTSRGMSGLKGPPVRPSPEPIEQIAE